MKRLLTYLFLVLVLIFSFQSWSKADDISEFEIEGISIGDSALNFFSEEEIKNGFVIFGKDKSIYKIELSSSKIKQYDGIGFYFSKGDKNYIIKGITAALFFDDFNQCKQKKKEIEKDVSNIFSSVKKDSADYKHPLDKKSLVSQTTYKSNSMKGIISIACYDWHKNIEKNKGWYDHLAIEIYDADTEYWIRFLAH